MTTGNKAVFAYILIAISLLITTFIIMKPSVLIPDGYDLAIDGYVISRTLILIFGLYSLLKLGLFLAKQKDN
jgi:hypothetical protein